MKSWWDRLDPSRTSMLQNPSSSNLKSEGRDLQTHRTSEPADTWVRGFCVQSGSVNSPPASVFRPQTGNQTQNKELSCFRSHKNLPAAGLTQTRGKTRLFGFHIAGKNRPLPDFLSENQSESSTLIRPLMPSWTVGNLTSDWLKLHQTETCSGTSECRWEPRVYLFKIVK